MITSIELKGVDRFASTLGDAADALGDMRDAADEAGRIVSSLAATTAPRKTGRLASSVAPMPDAPSTVVVGSDLIYAPPIHNGWAAHRIAPNPFLATAAERTTSEWVGAYERGAQRALDGVEGV